MGEWSFEVLSMDKIQAVLETRVEGLVVCSLKISFGPMEGTWKSSHSQRYVSALFCVLNCKFHCVKFMVSSLT